MSSGEAQRQITLTERRRFWDSGLREQPKRRVETRRTIFSVVRCFGGRYFGWRVRAGYESISRWRLQFFSEAELLLSFVLLPSTASSFGEEMEEDLYAVLRLEEAGPQVVHAVIRKAYRKRALELHPDKRGDDPVAAVEFQKLQKAYDILSDEKARASYDELQRVRKERVQKESRQSEKRQKMMRDLAEKEKAYETEKKVKSQEEDVSRRLKAEIARISKKRGRQFNGPPSSDQGNSAGVDAREQDSDPPIFGFGTVPSERVEVPPQSSDADASHAERTLKVSWTCLEGGAGDYSATELKQIFEEFGVVEDLVVRSGKSRKKRSALIVMVTKQAAVKATENVCGEYSNPLLVVPLLPGTSAH